MFHWIEGKKPVIEEEDDWILHEDDLVALADVDPMETSLMSSFLNVRDPLYNKQRVLTLSQRLFRPFKQGDGVVDPVLTYFSQARISAAAKSLSVFIAVTILIVPVSIMVWTPWKRAWVLVTTLLFVLLFSTLLSLSAKTKAKDVLLGSAA